MKIRKVWIKPTVRRKRGKIEYIKGHYSNKFVKEKEKCKVMTKVTGLRCRNPAYLSGYCMRHYRNKSPDKK